MSQERRIHNTVTKNPPKPLPLPSEEPDDDDDEEHKMSLKWWFWLVQQVIFTSLVVIGCWMVVTSVVACGYLNTVLPGDKVANELNCIRTVLVAIFLFCLGAMIRFTKCF